MVKDDERRSASVGLRMPPTLKSALEELARADGRSLADYIQRALREHVDSKTAENGKPAGKRK